ncbi:wax ester/triacylglycerol synthase domain-containing protein [Nonomuraea sp. NPDC049725]|uniref:wax ester/triacylglycerol synthase domain-containing protein n=1 Tax=Nonomuraea sp. NPDC049725 TaxID=3154508 RepID=UPI0034428CD4
MPTTADQPTTAARTTAVPLTVNDRFLLRLAHEADPARDADLHLGVAVRLPGPPPSGHRLHRLIGDAAVRARALTYRLTGTGRRVRWEPDPAFDPAHHVRHHHAAPGQDPCQAVGQALREHPLPRSRPLWSLVVVEGHAADEHLLCYRAHHVFQDGLSVARTISALALGRTLPPPAAAPGGGRGRPGGAAIRQAIGDIARFASATEPWHPPATDAPATRHLGSVSLDAGAFRDIARSTGTSFAQIAAALLAGVVKEWTEAGPAPAGPLPPEPRRPLGQPVLSFPIGRRDRRHDDGLGNHAVLMPIRLPSAEPTPRTRLRAVAEQTGLAELARHRRGPHASAMSATFSHVLARLAASAARRPLRDSLGLTLLHGATALPPAHEIFAVPSLLPGAGGQVAVLPGRRTVSFSYAFDARLPGLGHLPALVRQALADLHADVVPSRP